MLSRYRVNCVALVILIFGQLCWPFYRGIRSTVETLLSRYPVNSGDLDPEQLLDPFSHLAEEQLGNHTHQFLVNTLIIIDVMIIAGKQEYRHGNWKPEIIELRNLESLWRKIDGALLKIAILYITYYINPKNSNYAQMLVEPTCIILFQIKI